MEVVTAAQRLSIIDLELYKGAAARVRGWTEIGSKGASPDRRRFKFQLGGPSLHIIRPRSERHSSLISLRLAGFPCALSTAIPRRSAPIQSRGQIYACMPQVEPHPTEPHTVHLQSCPQVGPTTFLFVFPVLLHWHWPAGDLINVNDIHYPEVTTRDEPVVVG